MLLGQEVIYKDKYDNSILYRIERDIQRQTLDFHNKITPFKGIDVWNLYEVSWLNPKNKPIVAIGKIIIPSNSKYLVESKSLKLYFNSLNNTNFLNKEQVKSRVKNDLENLLEVRVVVELYDVDENIKDYNIHENIGFCIDEQDIEIDNFDFGNTKILSNRQIIESEKLYSNLLRSNCLITNQPDWASLFIEYKGPKIDHESLLRYIISYRNHSEFHEHCVERIFMDIYNNCNPSELTIYARYTRRGGIDINPYRTTKDEVDFSNKRNVRQ